MKCVTRTLTGPEKPVTDGCKQREEVRLRCDAVTPLASRAKPGFSPVM